jgi:hypothetical protein
MIPAGAKCATIEGDRKAPNVPFTYRLKMPDNYRIAPHFHPADEHVTVISGTLNMDLGEKVRSENRQAHDCGKLHGDAKRSLSLRMDSRRNDSPSSRDRAVGTHVRKSEGRPAK